MNLIQQAGADRRAVHIAPGTLVEVVPIPVLTPAGTTSEELHGIVYNKTTGSTGWTEALLQKKLRYADAELEVITPSIAELDEDGNLTRLSDGVAIVRATSGRLSQRIVVDMRSSSSVPTSNVITGFAEDSIPDIISSEVLSRMNSTKTAPMFSSYNLNAGTFTRNPDFWLSDVDFSGSPVATKLHSATNWTAANRGMLVTPRHCIACAHWATSWPGSGSGYVVGGRLRFLGASGIVYEREIISVAHSAYLYDAAVALLDQPLPEEDVAVYPVMGSWGRTHYEEIANGYGGIIRRSFGAGLVVYIDKDLRGFGQFIQSNPFEHTVVQWDSVFFPASGYAASLVDDSLIPQNVRHLFKGLVVGDSGSPVFAIIDGSPVVAGLGGAAFPGIETPHGILANLLIAAADNLAVASGRLAEPTGLTVTISPDPTA